MSRLKLDACKVEDYLTKVDETDETLVCASTRLHTSEKVIRVWSNASFDSRMLISSKQTVQAVRNRRRTLFDLVSRSSSRHYPRDYSSRFLELFSEMLYIDYAIIVDQGHVKR